MKSGSQEITYKYMLQKVNTMEKLLEQMKIRFGRNREIEGKDKIFFK